MSNIDRAARFRVEQIAYGKPLPVGEENNWRGVVFRGEERADWAERHKAHQAKIELRRRGERL